MEKYRDAFRTLLFTNRATDRVVDRVLSEGLGLSKEAVPGHVFEDGKHPLQEAHGAHGEIGRAHV